MLYDIYALQQMYGVNYATRASDTIYGFRTNAGSVYNFAITKISSMHLGRGRHRTPFSALARAVPQKALATSMEA